MQEILGNINHLENELKSLLPMNPEFQKSLDKKFRLEFNYNSNHLEGNTLTYGETQLLLIFDKTTGDHTHREHEEMKAHDVAYELISGWAKDTERPLNETDICNINEIILVKPFWKEARTPEGEATRRLISIGKYKAHPNSVQLENGEIFEYASVVDTPILMGELIEWYNQEEKERKLHPVVLAATFHYRFVRIHPFDDGNGRTARLLMNYILMKHGYPSVVIKTTDKKKYLAALNKADSGDLKSFIKYIVQQLEWSLKLCIKAAKGESIEDDDDIDKQIELLKRNLKGVNKIVLKSESAISRSVTEIYIPILESIDEKYLKIASLFKSIKWGIYNISADNALERIMTPYKNKTLQQVKEILVSETKNGENGNYSVRYLLERFNDEDDTFNTALFCSIKFSKYEFEVIVEINDSRAHEALASLKVQTVEKGFVEKRIKTFKRNYNWIVMQDDINQFVRDTVKTCFKVIEKASAEIEEKRNSMK